MDNIDKKLDQMMEYMMKINDRLEGLENRFDTFDKRFDEFDKKVDASFDILFKKSYEIDNKLKDTKNIKKLFSEEALKAAEAI